jgi:RimJ/RimL family protein N-acetyltransferase
VTALETARLHSREARAEDLPDSLPVYRSHPEYVAQNEGSAGEAGRSDRAMLRRDWHVQRWMGAATLGIYLRETGEAVGMAGYLPEHPDDGASWLGSLVIAAARPRQGLGAEACARLAAYFGDELGWRAAALGDGGERGRASVLRAARLTRVGRGGE